jgi:hypothetical protein
LGHDHFVDARRIESGSLQNRLNDVDTQRRGAQGAQGPAEGSDGCAQGGDYGGSTQWGVLLRAGSIIFH